MSINSRVGRSAIRILALFVLAVAMAGAAFITGAHAPATSVTIVNNSGGEIKHVYLSPTTSEDWGPDQIDPSTISAGGSYTLSNVSCSAADIKVIAEDQDGCFLYKVVACGESTTWTITSESARDCGN